MKNNADIDMYKGLASYFLPDGVLEYFDVVDFAEEPTPEDKLYTMLLHLYLDERDNRPDEMSSAKPNGFTEESRILDVPIRDRKTILHVRHRRWQTSDGHNYIVSLENIAHTKTQYSKELGQGVTGVLDDPAIREIAARHGKSAAQIVLRWHMQRGLITIPRCDNDAYTDENIRIFDFELSPSEMEIISGLNRNQRTYEQNAPDNFHW